MGSTMIYLALLMVEWEQTCRRKVNTAGGLSQPERDRLSRELDRTVSYLRGIDKYDKGPKGNPLLLNLDGQLVSGFDLTRGFFDQSSAEVAVLPTDRMDRPADYWVRNVDITKTYIKSETLLREIAENIGIKTRERVRQIVESTLMRLWVYSSAEIQMLYPFFFLPTRKPLSFDGALSRSEERGGNAAKVYKLITQGQDAKQIAQGLGISPEQLGYARRTLARHDTDVPYTRNPGGFYADLLEKIRTTNNPKQRQNLLDVLSRRGYERDQESPSPVTKPLLKMIMEIGFRHPKNLGEFIDSLQTAGVPLISIPNSTGNYFRIIVLKDQDWIKEVLLADPKLAKYRLKV